MTRSVLADVTLLRNFLTRGLERSNARGNDKNWKLFFRAPRLIANPFDPIRSNSAREGMLQPRLAFPLADPSGFLNPRIVIGILPLPLKFPHLLGACTWQFRNFTENHRCNCTSIQKNFISNMHVLQRITLYNQRINHEAEEFRWRCNSIFAPRRENSNRAVREYNENSIRLRIFDLPRDMPSRCVIGK